MMGQSSPQSSPQAWVETRTALLAPLLAVALAMAVGHLLVILSGENPARVFGTLLMGTWGNAYGLGQVLFKTTPLIFTGLAVAIPFRAGLFNIGAEGQAVLGALAVGVVGTLLPSGISAWVAIPLMFLSAFVTGGLWGALPGFLKARFGAHEVITSIMLNFVALALANWLVANWLALPETLHTAPIADGARLSRFSTFLPVFHGSALNMSLLVALLLAGAVSWFLFRTPLGFEVRAMGLNPRAAATAGISPLRISTLAMGLGGGCAGLVGLNFVMGYKGYYEDGFSAGIGFMGIAVALLGRNHPLGIVLAALLFGTLSQGGLAINAMVPKEIVDILQAVVVLAVVASTREVRAILRKEARS